MSGLLNANSNRREHRSKTVIDAEIKSVQEMAKECEKKLKELEAERIGIEPVNDFAKIRNNILFMDFQKDTVKFNDMTFDYNFDITDDGFPDGDDDDCKFCADCGDCRSNISERSSIDLAISNIEDAIKAYKELLSFLVEQKDKGVEWIADTDDCEPENYDFDG